MNALIALVPLRVVTLAGDAVVQVQPRLALRTSGGEVGAQRPDRRLRQLRRVAVPDRGGAPQGDGYAEVIGKLTPISQELAVEYFDQMIANIRDPLGYAVWMVPVVSARLPASPKS